MMKSIGALLVLLSVWVHSIDQVAAFSLLKISATARTTTRNTGNIKIVKPSQGSSATLSSTTQLLEKSSSNDSNKELSYDDGSGRGKFLLGFVLLVTIWFFSIPKEFRRTHLCFSDRCAANPTFELCHNCVTFGQLTHDIADYYKNGGGIEWNFEVGEETKAIFSGK